jgi:hypothetical protein
MRRVKGLVSQISFYGNIFCYKGVPAAAFWLSLLMGNAKDYHLS